MDFQESVYLRIFENYLREIKFHYNVTIIMSTSLEDRRTFLTKYR